LAEQRGPVRVLTLNRPEKLNAADVQLHRQLLGRWQELERDEKTRSVVLAGAGHAFCAGGDLAMLEESKTDTELDAELSRMHRALLRGMLSLAKPVVAAVQGPAVGFGAELAALCDFVVMGRTAYLADPHVQLGIPPSPGCQLIWPHLTSRSLAKEILMTGRRVDAEEALRLGLVNRLSAPEDVLAVAVEMAAELAALPVEAVVATKEAMNRPVLEEVARFEGLATW